MFSLIFFAIVAFILIVGVVVTSMRKKTRGLPSSNDAVKGRNLADDAAAPSRSQTAFNERRLDNTGSVVPASNEGLRSDVDDENDETNTSGGIANRPVV